MTNTILLVPLAVCLVGAGFAALAAFPTWQRWLAPPRLMWVVALAPLTALITLFTQLPALAGGTALKFAVAWLPSLGLRVTLYLDAFAALFALLISGIGTLVVIYAGYYFKGEAGAWRFITYLMLFMTSMLGVVMAGDVLTLFIFWEGTSLTSFLLVGYKYKDEAARQGALKAFLITGSGGIALLAGLLMVSAVTGSTELAVILQAGDVLRASPLYPVMLGLLALGAFTKSAQVPFHFWLPNAMSAPTPASAYLHSATMVKAGIYLLARFNPALGGTDAWFWLLGGVGFVTALTGAYLGFKQHDLKALLAYSTISQLGVLTMLIGLGRPEAYKALVIGILAHALYKCALFLVAGIVDHETGTRDIRRLGGLARVMPITFGIAVTAGLSMAGLPPLFGFLAKETFLAALTHHEIFSTLDYVFAGGAVVAGVFIFGQAALLVWETFLGRPKDDEIHGHEAPWGLWLAPAIPAALSLLIAFAPEPLPVAQFLADAAAKVFGDKVKVSLALWTGLNVPLLLSAVAITLGTGLFLARDRVRAWQLALPTLAFNAGYDGLLRGVDGAAQMATRVQSGFLRRYLVIMLVGTGGLLLAFQALALPFSTMLLHAPTLDGAGGLTVLRAFALVLAVGAAGATLFLRRDLLAILALGAAGLSMALFMALEPSPDVALVQVVVDILTTVILVLALSRIPRAQRERAHEFTYRQSGPGLLRDAGVALAAGAVMTLLVLTALTTRPRDSIVTPYYEQNAKPLTGAYDIVGAVVVDFRGFDTMIEITVFSMAGLAIYTLIRHASRKHGDKDQTPLPTWRWPRTILGIAGAPTSPFVHALAYALLPIALMVALTHMMYGHENPGDGFTAGVIISLAVGFWYVVFGYQAVKAKLSWLNPFGLLAAGIGLALLAALSGAVVTGTFFAPVDYGQWLRLPLPKGFALSSSFLFEVAICLAVLGSASLMIDTLGHPLDETANEPGLPETRKRTKR